MHFFLIFIDFYFFILLLKLALAAYIYVNQ